MSINLHTLTHILGHESDVPGRYTDGSEHRELRPAPSCGPGGAEAGGI